MAVILLALATEAAMVPYERKNNKRSQDTREDSVSDSDASSETEEKPTRQKNKDKSRNQKRTKNQEDSTKSFKPKEQSGSSGETGKTPGLFRQIKDKGGCTKCLLGKHAKAECSNEVPASVEERNKRIIKLAPLLGITLSTSPSK